MSIVQFPPATESPSEVIQQLSMVPAVQVLWLQGANVYYFVRGHPHLRFKDAALSPNGEFKPENAWTGKRAWGNAP